MNAGKVGALGGFRTPDCSEGVLSRITSNAHASGVGLTCFKPVNELVAGTSAGKVEAIGGDLPLYCL